MKTGMSRRAACDPGSAARGLLVIVLLTGFISCSLPVAPDRHAIVIGVTHYQDPNRDLTWPAADATAMRDLLAASGWKVDYVLLDKQASRAAIESAVKGLSSLLGPYSTGLVYYSGHGAGRPDFPEASFIPWDGVAANWALVPSKWIVRSDIDAWMETWPCANRILILDSCNSGGFVGQGLSVDSAPPNYGSSLPLNSGDPIPSDQGYGQDLLATAFAQASALLAKDLASGGDPSILTIAAAGAEEQSYDDGTHQHGAFSYYLLKAGTDSAADLDGDKLVTAVEAYTYATGMIKSRWNTEYASTYDFAGGMYMDFLPRISGGSGDIVLYDLR